MKERIVLVMLLLLIPGAASAARIATPVVQNDSAYSQCRAVNISVKTVSDVVVTITEPDPPNVIEETDCGELAPGIQCRAVNVTSSLTYCTVTWKGNSKAVRAALELIDGNGDAFTVAPAVSKP